MARIAQSQNEDKGDMWRSTCRNSGRFLWILGRMVRAPYSRLSLASQQGTTLCASTSWKGMLKFSATCTPH